ncbi:sensor domain-containing phosphodiesterase [Chitinimonas koreensis]|uniref:sensor domain-containing phosphodiesterase n=1 Tax=Chitinimonas koreensis TaxID=356302 RepID=UPI0004104102|nr:EAL domain-containing protein [Chitinimonas koreensis]QNM95029.1 EAL domain-containing protein [Chitinimonas koreensis]
MIPTAAPYQLDALLALLEIEGGQHLARHQGLSLHSFFQPIYSFAHRRVVGHEGLMRAWNAVGKALSPATVFATAHTEAELVTLDRLSRLLHARNFVDLARAAGDPPHWLFLNAEPNAFAHAGQYGRFFPEMLARLGLAPQRVVVEVLETAIDNNRALARAVDYFREIGCLIAIDDFGAGHSNVDRVWRLRPDIVKLDRSLISDATDTEEARLILPGLVSLLHEAGALVLAEGIETEAEAIMALEADCDLAQGYYLARPAPGLVSEEPVNPVFEPLWNHFNSQMRREIEHNQQQLAPYSRALTDGAAKLRTGESFEAAVQAFMDLPEGIRCFLLDADGRQVGANLYGPSGHYGGAEANGARYSPLDNADGAIWSRRQYFRQAMRRFGELQVSRPYLSIVGEQQCITLSLGLLLDGAPHVLCGDLKWHR